MRIAGIEKQSIVDGPGFRYTIFTQGCAHRCPGCHNPATWESTAGQEMAVEQLVEDIARATYIDGVTLSGGEPFDQPEQLRHLSQELHQRGVHIIAYSGYTWEQLRQQSERAGSLPYIDVLVDGLFVQEQRSLALRFRGSSNQRVIDVPASLQQNKVVLIDWDAE